MNTPARRSGPYTIPDWLAQPQERRVELIDGEFVEKAAPTIQHGIAQTSIAGSIGGAFHRRGGGGNKPGGWWIATEVDLVLDGRGFRPDLAGWRRDRMPDLPQERPIIVRPDWLCEIVSVGRRPGLIDYGPTATFLGANTSTSRRPRRKVSTASRSAA